MKAETLNSSPNACATVGARECLQHNVYLYRCITARTGRTTARSPAPLVAVVKLRANK